ncbi:MAG: Gfo/Idh/MocA family oxidoreductase [Planctomycetota bacterium]
METVRIGIIGCGGMGKSHAAALQKITGVAVAAAAETRAEVLGAFQAEFKVSRGYACFHEMLKAGGLEAVVVCLPTHLHRDAVVAAAAAHVQVFCEKPLARTVAEGAAMLAACADRGVMLQVGFVRRFDNGWNTARRIVQEGTLGTPAVWRDFRASYGPGHNPWYFDRAQGGGPFLDGMIHNFDFANHMFGR